jgi:NADH-quinone oxidoreductase subunit A
MNAEPIWPLIVYGVAAVAVAGTMLGLSWMLGQRHSDRATGAPYESGVEPTGSARVRLSVKFYVVAMLFVVFDLEAVFLYAWSVALREVGWAGYVEAVIFVAIVGVALAYVWRLGVLDWAIQARPAGRGDR